jgi:hypothetical protein
MRKGAVSKDRPYSCLPAYRSRPIAIARTIVVRVRAALPPGLAPSMGCALRGELRVAVGGGGWEARSDYRMIVATSSAEWSGGKREDEMGALRRRSCKVTEAGQNLALLGDDELLAFVVSQLSLRCAYFFRSSHPSVAKLIDVSC